MRLAKIDLRLRIAAALAALCIGVVSTLGLALHAAFQRTGQRLVEQLVAEELDFLVLRAPFSSREVPAAGPNVQYYVLRAPGDYDSAPAAFRELPPGHHDIGRGPAERHVAIRDVDGARYMVVYDSGDHELRDESFRELLFLLLGGVTILALALGYWLAGIVTRQLRELTVRVSRLGADAVHAPLERADHDPDVAALAHALDQYRARIDAMVRREQEFAANASHELRTPLTAIGTSCELLSAEPELGDKARARIGMIERAAAQMTEYIQALLLLAREQPLSDLVPVGLRDCAEEAAESQREEIARKGLSFEVAIAEGAVVRADRTALRLVLGNLIRNAVRYTEHGFVRVDYQAPRLTVSDSGTGIDARHVPRLFDRSYRADASGEGLGLGLAIVRRVCDQFGWKIDVQSRPGAGSAFVIEFP